MNTIEKQKSRDSVDAFLRHCNNGFGLNNGGVLVIKYLTITFDGGKIFTGETVYVNHIPGANCFTVTFMSDKITKILDGHAIFWTNYVSFSYSEESKALGLSTDKDNLYIMKPFE